MKTLRPSFDAACASLVGTPDEMTPSQCAALWHALNPARQQTRYGRQRWSAIALALREPLRREFDTVAKQTARQTFVGLIAQSPGKPPIALAHAHARYAERLQDIRLRMDAALRTHGHWCLATDESFAQPLRVVVANERAAGRPAGNTDWTQWEDPATVRRTTNIFEAGIPPQKSGRQWAPYLPDGASKLGAAAAQRSMKEWRGAFHDAIVEFDAVSNPPLAGFLRSPLMQQHIEDAIREQMAQHRGPKNRAFTGPGCTLWHALHPSVRIELAVRFAAALDERERILTPNPFALTDEEQARLTGDQT